MDLEWKPPSEGDNEALSIVAAIAVVVFLIVILGAIESAW